MGRITGYCIAVITAVLNWYAFEFLFQWLGAVDPAFLASATLASVVIHELGHLVVLEANGIKTHLVFLVLMGGAIPAKSQTKTMNNLSWSTQGAIALAGTIGNAFLVIIAAVACFGGFITPMELGQIANLNATLITFNLLPFGKIDGGYFAKMFFNSVSEKLDNRYALEMFAVVMILLSGFGVFAPHSFLFFLWAAFFGLGLRSRVKDDNPEGSKDPLAMSPREQGLWKAIYVLLICFGLVLSIVTPNWLIR